MLDKIRFVERQAITMAKASEDKPALRAKQSARKRQTGIEADTGPTEFALPTVALEDNFAAAFKASRGKADPALKLGF
jgi:hypothetical protein